MNRGSGTISELQFLEVLDPCHLHTMITDIDPVVRENVFALDHRDRNEVAVAKGARAGNHLIGSWRIEAIPDSPAASSI